MSNQPAAEAIFLQNKQSLINMLYRIVHCKDTAEDLVQDAYIRYSQASDNQGLRDPKSYLYRIAKNLALDYLRKQKTRDDLGEAFVVPTHAYQYELCPERNFIGQEELECIQSALSMLTYRSRQVFYLSRYQSKSLSEIAKELGIGETTARTDLKQALSILINARERFSDLPYSN